MTVPSGPETVGDLDLQVRCFGHEPHPYASMLRQPDISDHPLTGREVAAQGFGVPSRVEMRALSFSKILRTTCDNFASGLVLIWWGCEGSADA